MDYATFYVANDLFGIPIYLVQEIARRTMVYQIPGHDPRIEGLMNLRGRTTAVINLKRCLYQSEVKPSSNRREKDDYTGKLRTVSPRKHWTWDSVRETNLSFC